MKALLICTALLLSFVFSYAQKHPKVVSEKVKSKNFLDKRTHPNSDIIEFKFSDGISGTLVKRNDTWYNYNIRGEEKERAFDSKEAAVQKLWEEFKNLQNVGGSIGGAAAGKKSGPLKKDGTPDKRYKSNN